VRNAMTLRVFVSERTGFPRMWQPHPRGQLPLMSEPHRASDHAMETGVEDEIGRITDEPQTADDQPGPDNTDIDSSPADAAGPE
jgi:hypothetical protein